MKSLFKFVILSLFLLVISLNFVSGFGVSIPYSMQDPLRLYPGQSADLVIGLQSSFDEGDLILVPGILEGQNIVEITDSLKEYNVISNQPIGAEVHLRISVPDNKEIGKEYTVRLIFRDITKKEGGMVGFSTSMEVYFNVLIIEKPIQQAQPELKEVKGIKGIGIFFIFVLFLLIAIFAIILIIWLLVRNKRINQKELFLG
jgi:hypothetical protein